MSDLARGSGDARGATRLAQFYQRLFDRLRELPGVSAGRRDNALPMSDTGANGSFIIENGGETAKTHG